MKNLFYCFCIFAAILTSAAVYAQDQNPVSNQPLTDQQVDKAFDDIFARQQQLTRLQAKIVTEKKGGGIFKRNVQTWGYAYAQMPNLLMFVDRGEIDKKLPETKAATILIDGTYLWDIKPGETDGSFEAERMSVRNTADRDINIAALLIGANVSTGKELRKHYELKGVVEKYADNSQSYHFMLKTLPGMEKRKVKEEVDVWIRPGQVIPWKITSVRFSPKGANPFGDNQASTPAMKRTESTKYISDLKTNLTNPPLANYAPEVFWFGRYLEKYPNTRVMDTKGNVIAGAMLNNDLTAILSQLKAAKK